MFCNCNSYDIQISNLTIGTALRIWKWEFMTPEDKTLAGTFPTDTLYLGNFQTKF